MPGSLLHREARLYVAVALKAVEIAGRVVESVGVVHPQPRHLPFLYQLENEPVRRLEDCRVLHPYSGQIVDVEEPPVVDLLSCDAPVGKPEGLAAQKVVQKVEALRLAFNAVENRDVPFYVAPYLRAFPVKIRQTPFRDLLLPVPLGHKLRRGLRVGRQVDERGVYAEQLI